MQIQSESYENEMTEFLQIEREFEFKSLFKQLKIQNPSTTNKSSKKIKKVKLSLSSNSILQRRNSNPDNI